MQRDTMIVDETSNINLSHENIIVVRVVEFEAKGFHCTKLRLISQ